MEALFRRPPTSDGERLGLVGPAQEEIKALFGEAKHFLGAAKGGNLFYPLPLFGDGSK